VRSININILLIGISICAIVFAYAALPFVHSRWLRFWLNRRVVSSKALVLTFDDGPGWRITPVLLDMLAEYNVRATFFLLGRNIVGREAIVRRIAKEGHEICSHGYHHLHSWKVPPWKTLAGIKSGWRTIDAALDSDNRVYPFRPPYGKLNLICP
jgi:peptidoglycan/xylan/chitin deacetylase (PgdA/CDA1 family)